ncbi:hypothetical protein IFM89_011693, partial [Coptis chinensis]
QTSTLRNEIGVETTTSSPCLEIELFKEAPTNGVRSIWENTIVIKDLTTEQEHPVVITEQGPIVVYQAQSGTITDEVLVPVLIDSVVEDLQGRKYIQDKDNHSLIDEDFDTVDESGTVSETDHFSDDQGVEEGLVVVIEVTPPRGMEIDRNVKRDEVEGLVRELMEGTEMKKKSMGWKKGAEEATKPGDLAM